MKIQMKAAALLALAIVGCCLPGFAEEPKPDERAHAVRIETDLSGPGWRMWFDEKAQWKQDQLYLPKEAGDLSALPVNPPTGGWDVLNDSLGKAVSVPGTVEQYLGVQKALGVSWWWRDFEVPQFTGPRVVRLLFEATRLRAEVYVDGRLAGYDLVGETPWSIDLSGILKPGSRHRLAVRITNPGGNGSWIDYEPIRWGKYMLPTSYHFGGIYDRVRLIVTPMAFVDDVAIRNTPEFTKANVLVTIRNTGNETQSGRVVVNVSETADSSIKAGPFETPVKAEPGETEVSIPVSVPNAKLWSLEHPALYDFSVEFVRDGKVVDTFARRGGFRWLEPKGIGADAHFAFNGIRLFIRSAISGSWWAGTGGFPLPEIAEREVLAARRLGLNALAFHRNIGNRVSFEKADEIGLLYTEEPGGYSSARDAFSRTLAREKVLRMAKRDRSHPSLAWVTFINEQWKGTGADTHPEIFEAQRRDLEDVHRLVPDRAAIYTSAWAETTGTAPQKLHFRPLDPKPYYSGWWDSHRAPGPVSWMEEFYKNPEKHYGFTDNAKEIVLWGEEAAMSSPPQLGTIQREIAAQPWPGWDGAVYLARNQEMQDFLRRKNLLGTFADADTLCRAMADVSFDHQGRKIEDTRICDYNDGYFINLWGCFINENYSGVVDGYRNIKGTPDLIASRAKPLRVAVKTHNQILNTGESATVDFYLLNEKGLTGRLSLDVVATGPDGKELLRKTFPFNAAGGNVFAQEIATGVVIPVGDAPGMMHIAARASNAAEPLEGSDDIFAVSWQDMKLPPCGAVWENDGRMAKFFAESLKSTVPAYEPGMGALNWLVVSRPPFDEPVPVPPTAFVQIPGGDPGLRLTFTDDSGKKVAASNTPAQMILNVPHGATPDSAVSSVTRFTAAFEGFIVPPVDGIYRLEASAIGAGIDLVVDGKRIGGYPGTESPQVGTFTWKAGEPVPVRVVVDKKLGKQRDVAAQLTWSVPGKAKIDPKTILDRVANDGTRLIIADSVQDWGILLADATKGKYDGCFKVGTSWIGGQYFVKPHPLFDGLPTTCGLGWPYQSVLGEPRRALKFEGEELIAGANQVRGNELGTAVGVFSLGKGKIIFSSLRVVPELNSKTGPSNVARKLFMNFICAPLPN